MGPADFDNSSLYIDEPNIRAEYAKMAYDLKIWSDVYANAADQKRSAKLALARTKKAVEISFRENSTSKASDKAVEAEVESNPIVAQCADSLLEAELLEDQCKAIVDSLNTKRSMLMVLGGLVRTELATNQFTS